MLLRQIKYFVSIIDYNSFTEAAEQCFVSQSAISQQISALERDLGVKLIERKNRKFNLTVAGEFFYKKGKSLLLQAEQLRNETKNLSEEELRLRIGYISGYEGKELQQTIYEFTEIYPEVMLSLSKYSHQDLFDLVSSNEIDLVLSYQRRSFSDIYFNLHLRYIPLFVEVSKRSPIAIESFVTSEQLNDFSCIIIAKREQYELERDFYQNVLGFGKEIAFVENADDARLTVISNRGFLPVTQTDAFSAIPEAVHRIPVLDKNSKPVCLNYCAFWKKERTNYYIEEFAELFRKKFGE